MPITDNKINSAITTIQDLPRKATPDILTYAQLQAKFDESPELLRQKLNALIDNLVSISAESGAKNIGVQSIAGLTGNDVQTLLSALKTYVDSGFITVTNGYTKTQVDTILQGIILGQVSDGSITDVKLSNAAGQIKDVVSNHTTQLVDYTKLIPFAGTTTGSANAYVISTPTVTVLNTGMAVSLKFNIDSTGASTLNWCGLGAKGIKKANGTDVINLKAAGIYTLRYDGTNFILQGEGASGNATASDLTLGKTATTDAGEIIGTGVNAKRWASGTGTSASGTNILTVSGLQFRPSYVVINVALATTTDRFDTCFLFYNPVSQNNGASSSNIEYGVLSYNNSGTVNAILKTTQQITSDGFSTGMGAGSTNYNWIAFE